MTALAKLPNNQARQEVLDIVPKMIIIMRVPKFSIVSTKSGRELRERRVETHGRASLICLDTLSMDYSNEIHQ
ncbi:MAG: hypothetical protein DRR16_30620 [Candidatus Parabeggiatoa sp. nov. 3]|nr:MAG: hypothetical protein DRR00_31695 [Gammaproteobacteria bacterium]RKZ55074.1 MAG: hypothetical protein DRQ99_30490 [Gammaproteobacteria bacterium]RKZ76181.1 MAG: hypothetical protein DRR16_30620 [Gammaproteobacteria bacterium]